jgi:hypothetical protein
VRRRGARLGADRRAIALSRGRQHHRRCCEG